MTWLPCWLKKLKLCLFVSIGAYRVPERDGWTNGRTPYDGISCAYMHIAQQKLQKTKELLGFAYIEMREKNSSVYMRYDHCHGKTVRVRRSEGFEPYSART